MAKPVGCTHRHRRGIPWRVGRRNPELVEVIRAARGRGKRIVAVANASAASAAYWIATAADEVIRDAIGIRRGRWASW
ncbi:MAG: hypothetical protein U1F17_15790 [Burkholderiaceae bacterium]